MIFLEWLRVIFLGIVEGITEWLPISSTGHMILVDEIWKTARTDIFTPEFMSMFSVVIQLGAILAVIVLFFNKLNPISRKKTKVEKKETINLWKKVIIGCLPAGIIGVLLDDWIDAHLYNWLIVSLMLIIYGVIFILIEIKHENKKDKITNINDLSYKTAFLIGMFQILSLIPGTSRSGITIIGAMILGCSRIISTEFTFFLAIPIMLGASAIKVLKFLLNTSGFIAPQLTILILAMITAFLISIISIKFLLKYIKNNDFKIFGYYRIILGILVILYFLIF